MADVARDLLKRLERRPRVIRERVLQKRVVSVRPLWALKQLGRTQLPFWHALSQGSVT